MLLEAIRACFGTLPAPAPPLFAPAGPPAEDLRDARMRARAWALMSAEAPRPAVYIPGLQAHACPVQHFSSPQPIKA